MKITKTTPHVTVLEELGRRLAQTRKQQQFTQAALAKQAGLGIATIIRIENGQDAQLSSWIKIFNVLGLTSALDTLLPAEVLSPMAEVKQGHRRKRTKQASVWGDGKS